MRYIHLPPASKIAWDQAPPWGKKAKIVVKQEKQKLVSKASQVVESGREKGNKASPTLTPPQTTARLASLPYYVISVRNTSTSRFSELLPVQHNPDQPKYNYTCCACSNQPLWSQNCCRTILEDHSLLTENDQLASL